MQVYKTYFKILKQNLPAILIYVCIFLFITVMLTYFYSDKTSSGFRQSKSNIAFINHDENTMITDGLRDYLDQNANIIDLPDNQESLQDALFFRKIEYIVTIPAGFSQRFLSGENNVQIEKTSVQDSVSSVQMDFLINRYLSTVKLYQLNMPGISNSDLSAYIKKAVGQSSEVRFKTYGKTADRKGSIYYTYLVYAMIVIIFLGVSSIMIVFNDTDLKRRNLGSPLKSTQLNMQLFFGNLSFAFMVCLIMVALGFLFTGKAAFNYNNLLLYLNLFCLTLVCLSLSFLIGNLISSREVQQAIANVLSLGLCFISGVFVPQQLLGKTINFIASFTPTYWYVKAVNDIGKLVVVNSASVAPVIYSMLIQIGFVVAMLMVALAISREKQTSP